MTLQTRKKRLWPLLLAAAMVLAPSAAFAADYWFLGAGVGVYDFVDVTRITDVADGQKQAWTTRVVEGRGGGGRQVKTVLSLYTFDCRADTTRLDKLVEYRANGSPRRQQSALGAPFEAVVPGSVGAAEFEFVCADPFSRAEKAKDLGDVDPVARADALHRSDKGGDSRRGFWHWPGR